MLGTLLQGTEGEGIPDSPRIRTFKVGINHCGRMLIGGALKLNERGYRHLQDEASEMPIFRKGKDPRIRMTRVKWTPRLF